MKTYTELYEKIRKKMAAVCGDSAVMSYPVPAGGKKEMVFIYPSATCLIRTRPLCRAADRHGGRSGAVISELLRDGLFCSHRTPL